MNDREFLEALKKYIEESALTIEDEFSSSLNFSVEDMIAADAMPPIYKEVLRRLAAIAT